MPEPPSDHRKSWTPSHRSRDHFVTTQWSLVAQAGNLDDDQSRDALQVLCQNYWFPLYAFARRRMDSEKARDMTQEFFCVLLDKNYLESADQQKGRFRAFLLTAFKRFLANQHDRENTIKRGGHVLKLSLDFDSADSRYSLQPVDDLTPDKVFERQWVLTLLENVMDRMREYYTAKSDEHLKRFEILKPMIIGEAGADYAELSKQLGPSVDTLRVQVHRMRGKYQEMLRAEIAGTVASQEEVDDEIQRLFELMG
jgi:DNA-directed RNA polymerase specialized sigma24 family protein